MSFFHPKNSDPRLENRFRAAYLQECISHNRSNIAFSEFEENTRRLYWQVLKTDPRAAEKICPEVNGDFYALHKKDMETNHILREAITLHARNAFGVMQFRPTVLHFIFDKQGKLLFAKSRKAVQKGANNWNLLQGGMYEGEDILSASRREVCAEECPSVTVPNLSGYRFLGSKDIKCANGRKTKDGFTRGKRYITVSVQYSGSPELDVDPEEIAEYEWVKPQDIQVFLATMREEKQRFLIEKLMLIPQTRALAMGILR